MSNKAFINYYIFNENVVPMKYDCISFKAKLSLSNFKYGNDNNALLIENLITNKHFRNKGYATKLLNYIISNYGNSYSIYLMVLKSNKLAIDFYRKKGFLFVNKFKNTYICKLN